MAIFEFRRRPVRRLWLLVLTTAALSAAFLFVIGPAGALTGSPFESADGNLIVNGAPPAEDWQSTLSPPSGSTLSKLDCTVHVDANQNITPGPAGMPGLNCGLDKPTGATDDSFGQGSKEDIVNPTVVDGSIPNNKSDLTRFYVATEKVSGTDFLYLAFERANTLGTANIDFEFNQSATLDANGVTPVRTPGDKLITYDFTKGGKTPVLGELTWVTSANGSASDCFSSNALPCWGMQTALGAGVADGQVNDGFTVTDPIPPGNPRTLPSLTFGEAGINLATLFSGTSGCTKFGKAFVKSRSSAAFGSELKDFIAPIPVNITNCGELQVHKYIDANESGTLNSGDTTSGADVAGWSFSITGPNSFSCSGTTDTTGKLTSCLSGGSAVDLTKLAPGSYTITETAPFKTIDTAAATFNTDPGPAPATTSVSKTATVVVSSTVNRNFGNTCFNKATLTVNGVPSGTPEFFIWYKLNGGSEVDVAISGSGSLSTTVNNLRIGDGPFDWGFGSDGQKKTAETGVAIPGYSACSVSRSAEFGVVTITGSKYKDINHNGAKDTGEGPLAGFVFHLMNGTTVIATDTSNSSGVYQFANQSLAPGTYTVHEDSKTGWQQTDPALNADRSVTIALGDSSKTVAAFGNTPLSNIAVTFTAQTSPAATKSTISCPATGLPDSTTGSFSATSLTIGVYTCTITITDP